MEPSKSSIAFDKQRASSFNTQYQKLAPLSDAIHLLLRVILLDLPADAQVLCVGAGTGAELLFLAKAFPGWQFAVVEPAVPMLDLCRQRAEDAGIAARCTFHAGYLDTLPDAPPFHAATSLLVTHFLLTPDARRDYWAQIAARLRPEGVLVASTLASDMTTSAYQSLLEVWLQMQRYTGTPVEAIAKMPESYGRDVAILPPVDIEAEIAASGFHAPTQFYQTLLIHGWYAKRSAQEQGFQREKNY